jgi:hypothetical protein
MTSSFLSIHRGTTAPATDAKTKSGIMIRDAGVNIRPPGNFRVIARRGRPSDYCLNQA